VIGDRGPESSGTTLEDWCLKLGMSEGPEPRVDRLRWAGPLTVLLSVGTVAIIREIAVAVVQPPTRYMPLLRPFPIFDTAVLGTAAVLVFARFCRDNVHPIADYTRLAIRVLLISFVPDILLATTHAFGGGWSEAFWLMAMHVAVWAICITVLPAAVARTN
jgi:hypothetical protein